MFLLIRTRLLCGLTLEGLDRGFASHDDGGKRSETEDREFSEWRYRHLAEPEEFDALVPERRGCAEKI